jgi:Fe-S oxidoreductase
MKSFFTPKVKSEKGRAKVAPYALRKVEASLIAAGFSEEEVYVTPPDELRHVIGQGTKVVGITVHDPLGLEPVSMKLSMLFGGGRTWTAEFFREMGEEISRLKSKYGFKVIAGGPGAWQLEIERPPWVDTLFFGHAELDFPPLVKSIIDGGSPPPSVKGRKPKANQIPTIINPARLGEVQVTRGCPRGCWFCSITPDTFLSIPLEDVAKEVEVNRRGGAERVELVTDDILLYGASKLRVNHDAVVKLFETVMSMGMDGAWFPHISVGAVMDSPKTVKAMSEISRYDKVRAAAPVVGLETGSEKILNKYMRAKAFPWSVRDWNELVIKATAVMNDSYIYPCYTMTIGYPEENDQDVEESIRLVESIIDHGFKTYIFPLPVVPMGNTMIRDNPFPTLKRLPGRYWDLLYMSWKWNLKVIRDSIPTFTGGLGNRVAQTAVRYMIDRVFDSIEWVFKELSDTKGESSLKYSNLNLNNTLGVLKSVYWLTRLAFIRS